MIITTYLKNNYTTVIHANDLIKTQQKEEDQQQKDLKKEADRREEAARRQQLEEKLDAKVKQIPRFTNKY